MQIIKFFISNQRAWRYTSGVITEGADLKFEFIFKTEEWKTAPTKIAVFNYKGKNYEATLDEYNQCRVPKDVIHDPCFKVSLYGGEIYTNTVKIPIEPKDGIDNGGCDCDGKSYVYVPEVTANNMLVFTLQDTPGDEKLEFDIDKSNNWSETDETVGSNYIWEPMQ